MATVAGDFQLSINPCHHQCKEDPPERVDPSIPGWGLRHTESLFLGSSHNLSVQTLQNAPKSCNGSLIMHNCDYHIHMNIYSQRGTWTKNLSWVNTFSSTFYPLTCKHTLVSWILKTALLVHIPYWDSHSHRMFQNVQFPLQALYHFLSSTCPIKCQWNLPH